mmetsp:Transcript_2825/g.4038  ORF Transcript_2825/g.4038 Transcript_2825/m.4038 type:complete len:253 (-) Transcript_2825:218-976(-)
MMYFLSKNISFHTTKGFMVSGIKQLSRRVRFSVSANKGKTALIMGPPGGGKGTISKKILKDFSFVHVSTGDVLRMNVAQKTELGLRAKQFMDKGEYVPDGVMIDLVKDEIQKAGGNDPNVLLDGFPRTEPQAVALDEVQPVNFVINLEIPHDTIVERLSGRWTHPGSGRVYAYDYNPPKEEGKDDVTGEPLVQREDDQPKVIRSRLEKYDQLTLPVLEFYRKQNKLHTFAGTESDAIYPEVKKLLDSLSLKK